jgi:hypothetical protein
LRGTLSPTAILLSWRLFNRRSSVLWVLLASAISGLLLGLRFRVPALAAAAVLMVIVNILVALISDWPAGLAVFAALASLVVLSCSYFISLVLAFLWSRHRAHRRTTHAPSPDDSTGH